MVKVMREATRSDVEVPRLEVSIAYYMSKSPVFLLVLELGCDSYSFTLA